MDCRTVCVATLAALLLAGCQSRSPSPGDGGFYGGDRPPTQVPADLAAIPDAVPVPLPKSRTGNNPYEALGKTWYPMESAQGYRKRGVASWYGSKFHGRRTSSGEPYDMFAMTAAHPVLPLPTFVRVTSLNNGRSVVVKVNDRGPFLHDRIIDLSYAAAWKLGITATGTGRVEVEALEPAAPMPVVSGTAGNHSSADQPVPTSGVSYAVQVGAFSELANALQLRNRLRDAGFAVSPPQDEAFAGQGAPFRVLVGPYGRLADADQALLDLKLLTGVSGQLREI